MSIKEALFGWGEIHAAGWFLSKFLTEEKIKEVAERVGGEIDKILDERYKEKRSEELQGQLCDKILLFGQCLVVKLKEDWKNKKHD